MKTPWLFLLATLTLASASSLRADDTTAIASEADASAQIHRALVTVDGHVLFSVRGASVYPAEQRANAISQHIKDAAQDTSTAPGNLRLGPEATFTSIYAGPILIMRVFDADAVLEKVARTTLVELYSRQISATIADYRREREPRRLLMHLVHAGVATLILLAFVWGLWAGFRFLNKVAQRQVRSTIEQLQSKVSPVIQTGSLWGLVVSLLGLLKGLACFGAIYAYLAFVLALFPWTRALGESLLTILINPLKQMGAGFVAAFPGLVFVGFVILLARYVLKALRLFFQGIEYGRIELTNFDRDWAKPTYKIARFGVIAFAIVVAYPYIPGSTTDAFKGITLLLGLVFSLGSSSVISNLVAGYSMTYRRTFRLGEIVRVGEIVGAVADIGLVVTRIRTPKNEDVVVPNSQILNTHVVNYSTLAQKDGLILHTKVGIGYETSWRQVDAMLKTAAERTPGLLKEPKPFVHLRELGDFAVVYELNVHCQTPHKMLALYTALHKNILDLFNEYGVQIMTPAYEGDPEKAKVVPKDQWYAAPAVREKKTDQPVS